jgi:hypothetical protein
MWRCSMPGNSSVSTVHACSSSGWGALPVRQLWLLTRAVQPPGTVPTTSTTRVGTRLGPVTFALFAARPPPPTAASAADDGDDDDDDDDDVIDAHDDADNSDADDDDADSEPRPFRAGDGGADEEEEEEEDDGAKAA